MSRRIECKWHEDSYSSRGGDSMMNFVLFPELESPEKQDLLVITKCGRVKQGIHTKSMKFDTILEVEEFASYDTPCRRSVWAAYFLKNELVGVWSGLEQHKNKVNHSEGRVKKTIAEYFDLRALQREADRYTFSDFKEILSHPTLPVPYRESVRGILPYLEE